MEFLNPQALFLLSAALALAAGAVFRARKRSKKLKAVFGKRASLLVRSVPPAFLALKPALSVLALSLMILSLARPYLPDKEEVLKERKEGAYIILAADISLSMLAEDIKPSRLFFMKRELSRFLDLSYGDRIALIAFAGEAVLIAPFTSDRSIIKLYLQDLSPSYLSAKGSNFRRLLTEIERALDGLNASAAAGKETAAKIVVLASDGEDHGGTLEAALPYFTKQKIRFFTLAFGSEDGAAIPLRDRSGNLSGYKRRAGEAVITKLRPSALKAVAKATEGAYYRAGYDGKAVNSLREDIDKLKKTAFLSKAFTQRRGKELFQWPAALALLFLLTEIGVSRLIRSRPA